MQLKRCTKCKLTFLICLFHNETRGKYRVASRCKECFKVIQNSDKAKATRTAYKHRKRANPAFRQMERDKMNAKLKSIRRSSSEGKTILNKRNLEYKRNRAKSDPSFKMTLLLRSRLSAVLKGRNKVGSAVRDLGCSPEELKIHIESKFYRHLITGIEMTWENWGMGDGKWNIDHIKELASFDLTNRDQLLLACNYKNLQPLWFDEHITKTKEFMERNYYALKN